MRPTRMQLIAGIDLGGTAINYPLADTTGRFLIERLCEHPARAVEGPDICLQQIADGLTIAVAGIGHTLADVLVAGLDTPGPASAAGVLSAKGSTNFVHAAWAGVDLPGRLSQTLGCPVTYLNDGNAGALWGHVSLFGLEPGRTSVSAIIGTGLGGGVIVNGGDIKGRSGFGGELGHVLLPYQSIEGLENARPLCNCGRVGDLESLCSLTAIRNLLLPLFLSRYPGHELEGLETREASRRVRGLAEAGDAMARDIFRVQARALGLFCDQMINIFDPDALIIGGGALEASEDFQRWFIGEIQAGMPVQREEQATIPIHVMPNGDTASARGAALEGLRYARLAGLIG
jgi:glucokinase